MSWLGSPYAPLVAHFGLVIILYTALTVVRVHAVRRGRVAFSDFVRSEGDTPLGSRIARNLSNQFELPVFAWLAVIIGAPLGLIGPGDLLILWLLIGGRMAHSVVQIGSTNVPLRGLVYTITALCVVWIMARVALGIFPS